MATTEERVVKLEQNLAAAQQKIKDLIAEKNRHLKLIDGLTTKVDAKEMSIDTLNVSTINVKADNSKYNIVLHADNNIAGLWIRGTGVNDRAVAIYNNDINGPVVGVWGTPAKDALDIALSTISGPTIQIYDRNNGQVYMVTPQNIAKVAPPIKI